FLREPLAVEDHSRHDLTPVVIDRLGSRACNAADRKHREHALSVAHGVDLASAATADPVLLLTGPPGSGKTTTARLIATRAARGVHVEADSFFDFRSGTTSRMSGRSRRTSPRSTTWTLNSSPPSWPTDRAVKACLCHHRASPRHRPRTRARSGRTRARADAPACLRGRRSGAETC